jgi:hypothetical protein
MPVFSGQRPFEDTTNRSSFFDAAPAGEWPTLKIDAIYDPGYVETRQRVSPPQRRQISMASFLRKVHEDGDKKYRTARTARRLHWLFGKFKSIVDSGHEAYLLLPR